MGHYCMLRKILILSIFIIHFMFSSAFAVEVAPRITDREIVEALTEIKAGQRHLNQRIDDTNRRIDDLDKKLNQRIDDLDKKLSQRINDLDKKLSQRIDDMGKRMDSLDSRLSNLFNLTLTLFSVTITLIAGLFGYIIWDRRTMMKPVQERLERLEKDIERDLDLRNEHGDQ